MPQLIHHLLLWKLSEPKSDGALVRTWIVLRCYPADADARNTLENERNDGDARQIMEDIKGFSAIIGLSQKE